MTEFLDLVPFARPPQWGAWEPLALTMILTGGVALPAAGLAAWHAAASWAYLFALTALCALLERTSAEYGHLRPRPQTHSHRSCRRDQ